MAAAVLPNEGGKPSVILVTGSTGHLGAAVCLALADDPSTTCVGVDIAAGPLTTEVGSIADAAFVDRVFTQHNITRVIHAATLHKPHVATHTKQQFVETNVSGTLCLLEAAAKYRVESFVFVSTTSVYSETIKRGSEAADGSATWITEATVPCAKNIYGVTKLSAEALCGLMVRLERLPVVILRVSRFFHEPDDDAATREKYADANSKCNEFLYRRVDVLDIVQACQLAGDKARRLAEARGWTTAPLFVISAPPPFLGRSRDSVGNVREAVLCNLATDDDRALVTQVYAQEGWTFPDRLDRVYDASLALTELGWKPRMTFIDVVRLVQQRRSQGATADLGILGSDVAVKVGRRGYHGKAYAGSNDNIGQPFPV